MQQFQDPFRLHFNLKKGKIMKRKRIIYIIVGITFGIFSSCDLFQDIDVPNYNDPNRDQVFANAQDYPSLLSGAYNAWWNHLVGASPQFALLTASETLGSGYGAWGSNPFYRKPRESVPNTDGDPVLQPQASWWYGLYQAIPTVNDIMRELTLENRRVTVGAEDHTTSTLAHATLLQGILYGHLAMMYDKAFLMTETTDVINFDFEFTGYSDLMDYAIGRIDKAIEICDTATFVDPVAMLPEITFDAALLSKFANSMGARLLAYNARTADETANVNWAKVKQYANNGIDEDFLVAVEEGWRGLVIERDPWGWHALTMDWGWVRVHQRFINMMAPEDPNAAYPWPFGVSQLDTVVSPDQRFDDYVAYNQSIPWASAAATKGYHIMTHYTFTRFKELYDQGVGYINFYTKTENELYKAEANLRMNQNIQEAVDMINATRVDTGGLDPAQASEPVDDLMEKLYYERFVETIMTFPMGSYFDRRRTDVPEMGLFEGTVRHLPIPYQELNLHGFMIYTFGGVGNEM
jgi:hypothetical protein